MSTSSDTGTTAQTSSQPDGPNLPPDVDPNTGRPKPPDGCLPEIGQATDLDASLRFAAANHEVLRYNPGVGWLHWTGSHWASDNDGARAVELSKECARRWTADALHAFRQKQTQDNGRLVKTALALESASHLRAAADLAQSDPRIVISTPELDRDPWKFCVQNGTIDLRTGALAPHRREDFITKQAPVDYVPGVTHDALNRCLENMEKTSPGMPGFMARCFGAALTGDTSCEALFMLQGEGGSGKTTITEAFAGMLGAYAVKLPFNSFCLTKHGRAPGAASPDLVKLRGARFAYASEGDQSAKLDAGQVKALTGGEPYTARELFKAQITFEQTWKLWLVSNYDPRVDSEDTGMWRRIVKIPFATVPPEARDPNLKHTLTKDPAARSALLVWALKGCLEWQKGGLGRAGLGIPGEVASVTEAYRVRQDALADWWADLLKDHTLSSGEFCSGALIRMNYSEWATSEGVDQVPARRLNSYLESRGLKNSRRGGVRGWEGIFWNEAPGRRGQKTTTL